MRDDIGAITRDGEFKNVVILRIWQLRTPKKVNDPLFSAIADAV
jgi:hypothetical protein